MSYGASPTRWKVKTANTKGNLKFDLEVDDVLELTGSIAIRHRVGKPSFEWGTNCVYDPKDRSVKGDHAASGGADGFSFFITPGTEATGNIDPKGPGTGGHGTWTAEEGG